MATTTIAEIRMNHERKYWTEFGSGDNCAQIDSSPLKLQIRSTLSIGNWNKVRETTISFSIGWIDYIELACIWWKNRLCTIDDTEWIPIWHYTERAAFGCIAKYTSFDLIWFIRDRLDTTMLIQWSSTRKTSTTPINDIMFMWFGWQHFTWIDVSQSNTRTTSLPLTSHHVEVSSQAPHIARSYWKCCNRSTDQNTPLHTYSIIYARYCWVRTNL